MKKVSVIIPCYNHAEYVGEAIESALNQTYQNIEIVCINDASKDNSSEVIQKYANQYPQIVFVDLKENIGLVGVRNKAISISQGDYILPLDSDDKIHPTYIEKAVNILENNPQIGVVYSQTCLFGDRNELCLAEKFNRDNMLFYNYVTVVALFRKEDFLRVGPYNKNMIYGYEDWDLWLSFIEHNFDFYRIEEVLFYYRKHGETMLTDSIKKEEYLYKTIIKNHIALYQDFLFNNRDIQYREIKYKNIDMDKNRLESKYRKYRLIFKILLVIVILQLLIIIGFII